MDEQLKGAIRELCNRVEEVCDNGDWPTEDEQVQSLILEVREGIVHL